MAMSWLKLHQAYSEDNYRSYMHIAPSVSNFLITKQITQKNFLPPVSQNWKVFH